MVELIDTNGRLITDNERLGEIVGTSFVNPAFPLLRYRTGDIGYWSDCDCGLQTPVLGDIEGRWGQDWLVGLDGSLVSVTALNVHDDLFRAVKAMQFQQESPGSVTLALVPDKRLFSPDHKERIHGEMQKKVGASIDLEVAVVDELSPTISGKLPYVRQEVDLQEYGIPNSRGGDRDL
jgi:phenylacetate-CoA ligase